MTQQTPSRRLPFSFSFLPPRCRRGNYFDVVVVKTKTKISFQKHGDGISNRGISGRSLGMSEGRYALRKRSRVPQESSQVEPPPPDSRRFCPVCENFVSGSRAQVLLHINSCLQSDSPEHFDEYEWAGQRRVRSTSFLEPGNYSGFTSITHGNEDEVLDIENELLTKIGPSQYTTADIIFPQAETAKEQFERDSLLVALGHKKEVDSPENKSPSPPAETEGESSQIVEDTALVDNSSDPYESLQNQVRALKHQNEELRRNTICKICMDTYEKPLVSLECWHAHCEQCWLRSLGVKKLCPQCKVITNPEDLRKIYL